MSISDIYEDLVRAAFDHCGKREDPLGLADQSVYNHHAQSPVGHRLKLGLSYSLFKVSIDHDQSDILSALSQRAIESRTQSEIDQVITEAASILNL